MHRQWNFFKVTVLCSFCSILSLVTLLSTSGCKSRKFGGSETKESSSTSWKSYSWGDMVELESKNSIETGRRVAGSKVVIADYSLLQKHFPELKNTREESKEENEKRIDNWLVANAAIISDSQINSQNAALIQTKIPVESEEIPMIRPLTFNRSHMVAVSSPNVELSQQKLLNIKGSGAASPSYTKDHHGNGLLYFADALREYIFAKMMDIVLRDLNQEIEAVKVYAVIALPFEGKYEFGLKMRSAILVREAHSRRGPDIFPGGFPLFYDAEGKGPNKNLIEKVVKMEQSLRRYGIDSVTTRKSSDKTFGKINIQYAGDGRLVDMGGFKIQEKFGTDSIGFCKPILLGNRVSTEKTDDTCFFISSTDRPDLFKEPDQAVSISYKQWGRPFGFLPTIVFADKVNLRSLIIEKRSKNFVELRERSTRLYCELMLPVVNKLKVTSDSSTSNCIGNQSGKDEEDFQSSSVSAEETKVLDSDPIDGLGTSN